MILAVLAILLLLAAALVYQLIDIGRVLRRMGTMPDGKYFERLA